MNNAGKAWNANKQNMTIPHPSQPQLSIMLIIIRINNHYHTSIECFLWDTRFRPLCNILFVFKKKKKITGSVWAKFAQMHLRWRRSCVESGEVHLRDEASGWGGWEAQLWGKESQGSASGEWKAFSWSQHFPPLPTALHWAQVSQQYYLNGYLSPLFRGCKEWHQINISGVTFISRSTYSSYPCFLGSRKD